MIPIERYFYGMRMDDLGVNRDRLEGRFGHNSRARRGAERLRRHPQDLDGAAAYGNHLLVHSEPLRDGRLQGLGLFDWVAARPGREGLLSSGCGRRRQAVRALVAMQADRLSAGRLILAWTRARRAF